MNKLESDCMVGDGEIDGKRNGDGQIHIIWFLLPIGNRLF